MKSAPWVRFAMRISPKISEKPADSRNSRAPSARLFSVWMTQNCSLGLQVLRRREVARVHRVLQELLRLVGPELAHVGIAVDHAVHRSEEHTSELQSLRHLVCRLLLEKKKYNTMYHAMPM